MKCMYETILSPNELGGFDVRIPDLDCMTQGDSLDDAVDAARDLIALMVASHMECNESLPKNHFGHDVPKDGYAIAIFQEVDAPSDHDLTVRETAEVLDVTKARVYAMVRDGVLVGCKIGSAVMVSARSVREYERKPRKPGRPRKTVMG